MKPDHQLTYSIRLVILIAVGSILGCLMPSCTTMSGDGQGGWKYASVGGDLDGSLNSQGFTGKVNNSIAYGKTADLVKGLWSNYLMAEGLKYVTGKYYDAKGAELKSAETVDLEKLRNAKSAADAEASLKVLEANHAAEAAAAATAVPVP